MFEVELTGRLLLLEPDALRWDSLSDSKVMLRVLLLSVMVLLGLAGPGDMLPEVLEMLPLRKPNKPPMPLLRLPIIVASEAIRFFSK